MKDTTAERDQLAEEKAQLTEEKAQLLTRNTLLTKQLSTEKAKAVKTIQKQQDALKEKDDEICRLRALLASK